MSLTYILVLECFFSFIVHKIMVSHITDSNLGLIRQFIQVSFNRQISLSLYLSCLPTLSPPSLLFSHPFQPLQAYLDSFHTGNSQIFICYHFFFLSHTPSFLMINLKFLHNFITFKF